MKKKILGLLFAAPLFVSAQTSFTGSVSTSDGGLFATSPWDEDSSLSYEVSWTGSVWRYEYILQLPWKDVSHSILMMCSDVSSNNIHVIPSDDISEFDIGWNKSNNANPGLEKPVYGLKVEWVDIFDAPNDYVLLFESNHSPVFNWTDSNTPLFYTKGGKNGVDDTYLYTTQSNSIAVPGCDIFNPVPEVNVGKLMGVVLFSSCMFLRRI